MMRAKLKVTEIHSFSSNENIKMSAVGRDDGYPEDGTDENNSFAKWTPTAELFMVIANPNLFGKFHIGQMFYVDFSEVDKTA